ncbi:MAG: hypothetical protein J1E78_02160 [Muribaculaceae bacterium]|nr:hypothetical protein [Muribaculaceae bacterium]
MIKFFLRIYVIIIPLFFLQACKETEKTEGITAQITAAQMEGRRAAGVILGPQWTDSVKLQRALLDAKAKQSQYIINGKSQCAEAFDSAFISTIRTVNPQLARKLQQ